MSYYECRRFSRVDFEMPAKVATGNGEILDAITENLSLLGAALLCPHKCAPGDNVTITFYPEPEKQIEVKATLVEHEQGTTENYMAVYFTAVRSASFEVLRDVLVARAKRAAEVDEEITARRDLWPDTYH